MLDHNSTIPLYKQIANWLETEILKGNFSVDQKVYSQYQLADMFQINPATAARGLSLLGEEGILYDRRGLGKFVSNKATILIKMKRKDEIMMQLITSLVEEAHHLDINERSLLQLVSEVYEQKKERNDDDSM